MAVAQRTVRLFAKTAQLGNPRLRQPALRRALQCVMPDVCAQWTNQKSFQQFLRDQLERTTIYEKSHAEAYPKPSRPPGTVSAVRKIWKRNKGTIYGSTRRVAGSMALARPWGRLGMRPPSRSTCMRIMKNELLLKWHRKKRVMALNDEQMQRRVFGAKCQRFVV